MPEGRHDLTSEADTPSRCSATTKRFGRSACRCDSTHGTGPRAATRPVRRPPACAAINAARPLAVEPFAASMSCVPPRRPAPSG